MNAARIVFTAGATALALAFAGCSTWGDMSHKEKGTAVGATGGALVGAAVGGPVGAVVGAGAGGYVGHYEADEVAPPHASAGSDSSDATLVRSAQLALDRKGYDAGAADGRMGPSTESALRQFQAANGLAQTGRLDRATQAALGV